MSDYEIGQYLQKWYVFKDKLNGTHWVAAPPLPDCDKPHRFPTFHQAITFVAEMVA